MDFAKILFLLIICFLVVAAQSPNIPADKGYFCQEIRGGVYWVSDGAYNTMFVVSDAGVIVVDPLPTLGDRYLKAISEVTSQPIKFIIYSHSHTDHIGASTLFPRTAKIVAQRETAEILKRRNDPRRPLPDITFDTEYKLQLSNQLLELSYKGNNHEPGNIFIYAPRQKILMVVDVVYPGFMPYKNLGITEDVQGLMEAHAQILTYDFDTLVAGHVTGLGTREDVKVSQEFLSDLRATAGKHMTSLSFPGYLRLSTTQSLVTREHRSKWDLHNEYEREVIERCYAELKPRWQHRLLDTETYLRDNCWAMIEALTVDLPS